MAEILPYNNYLNDLITTNRQLDLQKGVYEDFYLTHGRNVNAQLVLNKIVNILKIAGEIVSMNQSYSSNHLNMWLEMVI